MDICRLQIGKIMYQYTRLHGLLPKCLDNMFLETNQVHSYNTRTSSRFPPFHVEQISGSFPFVFKGLNSLIP